MNPERRLDAIARKSLARRQPRDTALVIPNIIEFVMSDKYLGRPNLYPRQALLLKLIFLADELFTDYDRAVIEEWTSSFERTGDNGLQPDVLERLQICKAQGRPHFREVLAVIGRRGGKNHVGALAAAYVTWRYLCLCNPQQHYGLDPGRRLSLLVFAGNRLQAKANQFDDIVRVVTEGPCFKPFVGRRSANRLTLFTPHDVERLRARDVVGAGAMPDSAASLEIAAKESTSLGGRGPTSFAQVFDEMAHVVATGGNRSAEEIYSSATPSLDQFGKDALIYTPSSPWQSTGQFYANYQRSLEQADDGQPLNPEMLMAQLTSFDPYKDFERAHEIPTFPGGPPFPRLSRAIQTCDDEMKSLEKANPETFAVERLSYFATVQDAYLDKECIAAMFAPWNGHLLHMQSRGVLSVAYKAHADPSRSNANFALAIAHTEELAGVTHVVFDFLHVWRPRDFPDGTIDYVLVKDQLWQVIEAFMPFELTLDQWNSAGLISELQHRVRQAALPKRVEVYEKVATAANNWARAESFKTALGLGVVHAPYRDEAGRAYEASELLERELSFLQNRAGMRVDHPTSGPVQTDDMADAVIECVATLRDGAGSTALGAELGGLQPGMFLPGGLSGRPESPPGLAAQFSALGEARRRYRYRSSPARGGRFHR